MRSKGHEAIGAWVVLLLLVVGFPKSLKECKETLVASKDVVDSYIQLVISNKLSKKDAGSFRSGFYE